MMDAYNKLILQESRPFCKHNDDHLKLIRCMNMMILVSTDINGPLSRKPRPRAFPAPRSTLQSWLELRSLYY